jgi:anthranilate synthase component I
MIYPSKDEFIKLTDKYNMIPVYLEVAADMETPVSAYYKISSTTESLNNYSFLLESVEGGENIARYSFLGVDPHSVLVQKEGKTQLIQNGKSAEDVVGKDIFEKIKNVMAKYKPADLLGFSPFIGGAVGYASYDVINEIEPTVPVAKKHSLNVPDALFMIVDSFLIFDKVQHTIKVVAYAFVDNDIDLASLYADAVKKIEKLASKLMKPVVSAPLNLDAYTPEIDVKSNTTAAEYYEMVEKAKQYILDGDIIQVVISQRLSVKTDITDLALYRALRMINPSPYMFLLNCGDFSVVGASPEVHAKSVDGKMVLRPIAGTRIRGGSSEEDDILGKELLADPKERAEHIMLVDLARNDIGRIAEGGSVKVDQLMTIEKYSHVMHIVSNVTGMLDSKFDTDSVMRSTFPAGTVSGAPKVRAMQIIGELEKEKRGPYAGVVAYCSYNGNIDSCITIRTAVLKEGCTYIQAGAGIVADSVPKNEYEETMNKAGALLKAVKVAKQFIK